MARATVHVGVQRLLRPWTMCAVVSEQEEIPCHPILPGESAASILERPRPVALRALLRLESSGQPQEDYHARCHPPEPEPRRAHRDEPGEERPLVRERVRRQAADGSAI